MSTKVSITLGNGVIYIEADPEVTNDFKQLVEDAVEAYQHGIDLLNDLPEPKDE